MTITRQVRVPVQDIDIQVLVVLHMFVTINIMEILTLGLCLDLL